MRLYDPLSSTIFPPCTLPSYRSQHSRESPLPLREASSQIPSYPIVDKNDRTLRCFLVLGRRQGGEQNQASKILSHDAIRDAIADGALPRVRTWFGRCPGRAKLNAGILARKVTMRYRSFAVVPSCRTSCVILESVYKPPRPYPQNTPTHHGSIVLTHPIHTTYPTPNLQPPIHPPCLHPP